MREKPVALPAPDCDVLYGLRTIAAWLGMTPGACRARIADGTLPTFRLPGVKVICALKSSINRALAQHEVKAGKVSNQGESEGTKPRLSIRT
jgi:hypothetical protein